MREHRAFTLIELLIVVAIIGILAAIAVPNFLNAQVKAKLARVKSDIRNIAQAQEMYYLDNNTYPPESEDDIFYGRRPLTSAGLFMLTHPISYLSAIPTDPFQGPSAEQNGGIRAAYEVGVASKVSGRTRTYIAYCIFSRGPDLQEDGIYSAAPFQGPQRKRGEGNSYISTNGLLSSGDIFWYGGNSNVVVNLGVDGRVYNGTFPPNFGG